MATTWTEIQTMPAPNAVPGLRILIAEDGADCAESMAMLLRLYGHEVQIASSGPTAVETVLAYQPDVLLLDIGLPGMNGYQVAKRLKEHNGKKRPFIIAVTGFGMETDRRQSAESGIDLHLLKPVDPEQLQRLLARFQGSIAGEGQPY